MKKIKNLKAAKKLVKLYRKYSVMENFPERIKIEVPLASQKGTMFAVANSLTGFGQTHKCKLCKKLGIPSRHTGEGICDFCIFSFNCVNSEKKSVFCNCGKNQYTYGVIVKATCVKELTEAFAARADHIENLIKEIESDS